MLGNSCHAFQILDVPGINESQCTAAAISGVWSSATNSCSVYWPNTKNNDFQMAEYSVCAVQSSYADGINNSSTEAGRLAVIPDQATKTLVVNYLQTKSRSRPISIGTAHISCRNFGGQKISSLLTVSSSSNNSHA